MGWPTGLLVVCGEASVAAGWGAHPSVSGREERSGCSSWSSPGAASWTCPGTAVRACRLEARRRRDVGAMGISVAAARHRIRTVILENGSFLLNGEFAVSTCVGARGDVIFLSETGGETPTGYILNRIRS
jgi:hypothetical protein